MAAIIVQSATITTDSVGVLEMQKTNPDICILLSLMHGFNTTAQVPKSLQGEQITQPGVDFVNSYMDLRTAKSTLFRLEQAINRVERDRAIRELTPQSV